jgi:hypothetical protein
VQYAAVRCSTTQFMSPRSSQFAPIASVKTDCQGLCSIPEKALEHSTSVYMSNRFPNDALWWPASGEDVLAELPRLAVTGPGTTLALELKTTEAVGADHVLRIDPLQPDHYLNPPSRATAVDQAWPEPERFVAEDGGNERAVLHIPDSTLASPRDHHRRPQGESQR